MAIYDCFTFFNELDIQELRLNHMAAHVDMFVLVESPVTFRGSRKELFFAENQERFAQFAGQIRHVVAPVLDTNNPWARERAQREAFREALDGAAPDDTVLISDLDEIARPEAILAAAARRHFCYFSHDLFLYYLNWRLSDLPSRLWTKAYAAPISVISAMPSLSRPREKNCLAYLASLGLDPADGVIDHAGWHFSWTGGVDRLMTKLAAFSHDEPEIQRWRDPLKLREAIDQQRFFHGGEKLDNVAIDDNFPNYLVRNRALFEQRGMLSPNCAAGRAIRDEPRLQLTAEIAALAARLAAAEALASEARDAAAASRQCQEAIERSTSWRITAPLRLAAHRVKRHLSKPTTGDIGTV